jgi:hypothetical protein
MNAPLRRPELFLVVALVWCACGGAMKRGETPAQWEEARAVAVKYADDKHHFDGDSVREGNPRLPFLFDAALPGASAVLVHEGRIVDGGGSDALGRYLDAVDVYENRALTTDDVLDLLYVFDVFPTVDKAASSPQFYVTEENTELSMRSRWNGDALEFTLAYRLQPPRGHYDGGESEPEGPQETVLTVSFWTLHLQKHVAPRWTEQRRRWDYERERFVD